MKKPIGMLFASFALAGSLSANALADEQYRSDSTPQTEETVGLMSGAVIGAAAGGPPGAIIGAALGIFVGDGWVTRRDYRDMEAEWVTSKVEAQEAPSSWPDLNEKNSMPSMNSTDSNPHPSKSCRPF